MSSKSPSDPCPYLLDPAGKMHPLIQAVTHIGRAVENEIVIVDKRASREHARLRREGRKVFLEDLGSTNGTLLNRERVMAPSELRDGDCIAIGDVQFIFHDPDTTVVENPLPELEVDLPAGVVRVNRSPVTLAPKEFILLSYLYKNRGQICSKEEIGAAVWTEYESSSGIYDYQIENLVRRLRTKIESDPNNPKLLLTMRGLGYKLAVPE
ncbi:MAG: FHA domain-containing protein [Chloroflexota bacterium]